MRSVLCLAASANPEFRRSLPYAARTLRAPRAVCQPLQVAPSNKWSWVRADNTGHVDLVNLIPRNASKRPHDTASECTPSTAQTWLFHDEVGTEKKFFKILAFSPIWGDHCPEYYIFVWNYKQHRTRHAITDYQDLKKIHIPYREVEIEILNLYISSRSNSQINFVHEMRDSWWWRGKWPINAKDRTGQSIPAARTRASRRVAFTESRERLPRREKEDLFPNVVTGASGTTRRGRWGSQVGV